MQAQVQQAQQCADTTQGWAGATELAQAGWQAKEACRAHLQSYELEVPYMRPAVTLPRASAGAAGAAVCRHHAEGGAGATELAQAVEEACKLPSHFRFLYDSDASLKVQRCQCTCTHMLLHMCQGMHVH